MKSKKHKINSPVELSYVHPALECLGARPITIELSEEAIEAPEAIEVQPGEIRDT